MSRCTTHRILVPQPGTEPVHSVLEAVSVNHRTAREGPKCFYFYKKKKKRLKILYKCMLDDLESRTIKVHVFLYSSKQVILNESNEPFQKQ